MAEQGNTGIQKFLCVTQFPKSDGFHQTINGKFIYHKPVVPAYHRPFGWMFLRILVCRLHNLIKDTLYGFFRIMLVWKKKRREHTMDPPAIRIITLMPWDIDPFTVPTFIPDNTFAIIAKIQTSILAFGTKKFTALR